MGEEKMRHLPTLIFLLSILLAAGCVSERMPREQLPPEWQSALQNPPTEFGAIAGTYKNAGDKANQLYVDEKELVGQFLSDALFFKERWPVVGPETKVSLRMPARDRLTVELSNGSEVVAAKEFEVSFEQSTGIVILRGEYSSGFGVGGEAVTRFAKNTVRLIKGRDDHLYAMLDLHVVGAVYAMPSGIRAEECARWTPVKPE